MYRTLALASAMVLAGIASAQSDMAIAPSAMFHVQGTIDDPVNAVVPHVAVRFVGDNADRTVSTNDKGFYQTDLPVGTYTMTATFPPSGPNHISSFTKCVRFFRIPSPMTITLNGYLYPNYLCDGVWGGKDAEELYKDSCGGEDSFPFPAEGVPLRLDIRYVRRERGEKLVSYRSNAVVKLPVLVSYNLFALQADSVDYSRADGTVRAYGHVVIEDQAGQTSATSAAFKFDNGKTTRIW
jgi:Carboxypeptidase regulatory-like domain